jgi:very-short-patch-repair endonuclease
VFGFERNGCSAWAGIRTGDLTMLASSQGDIHEIPAEDLDRLVDPVQCLQVLDADSSQQQAIELAKAGGSFVLQGPPGTGKSQTIANIIAELLGLGRTVLFVSEKAAALEVVHRRLTTAGLADVCLALHSQKANKRDVVSELARVYSRGQTAGPEESSFNYLRMRERRDALNTYVRELHAVREPLGKSVFQVQGLVAQLSDVPVVPLEVGDVAQLTVDRLESMRDAMARVSGSADAIASIDENPWRGATIDGLSPEARRVTLASIASAKDALKRAEQDCRALADRLGLDAEGLTPARAQWMFDIARALADGPNFQGGWLVQDRLPELIQSEREAAVQHRNAMDEAELVKQVFREDVLRYDLDGLETRLNTEYRTAFARFGSAYRQEHRALAALTPSGKKPRFADIERIVPVAIRLRSRREWIAADQQRFAGEFGPWYAGFQTDWTALEAALAWAGQLSASFGGAAPESFADRVASVLADRDGLRKAAEVSEAGLAIALSAVQLMASWFALEAPTAGRLRDSMSTRLSGICDEAEALSSSIEGLAAWTRLARAVEACVEAGVADPTETLRSSPVRPDDYVRALENRVLILWLDYWIGETAVLRDFEATSHAYLIAEFRRLDADLKKAARRTLAARLARRRPHPSAASMNLTSSQPALLMKEAKKKRRHKPLRRLFAEIPDLLATLKPCMMMSPLSVGQFLPLKTIRFDAVVFDEASQVKPEDAVGPIMRGTQLIVVGDSKQLPPTSFFDVSMGDELSEDDYYDDDTGAFESILDLCGTIGLSERMLEWHYRSRREGLIAFSNNFLYDNRLVTFPSPDFDGAGTGVEFKYVDDGVYDRSRTRTNAREVQEILEIVRTHARTHPGKSLGVVAFSQAQMTAIDTALWRMRGDDPSLEAFFGNMQDEPFFVKNLENVQGDERDVIVFSVGYGPDTTGKIAMNFGPLNNRGGERRLNVAVTRAREKVVLVSSIRGADIDISRTNAEGVRLLKHYLDYAERGVGALDSVCAIDDDAEYGSLFEEEVAKILMAAGYRVTKQVGCSGYRIDLGVVHPDRPGQYALGIECDGASYHSAATARERDRLREQVLVDLGWKLYRIWSTDWFRSRPQQVEKLLAAVKDAIESPEARLPERVSGDAPELPATPSDEGSPAFEPPPSAADHLVSLTTPYLECELPMRHSDFYSSLSGVAEVVMKVVELESPLHVDALTRRVAGVWGIGRSGHKVQAVVREALQSAAQWGGVAQRGQFVYENRERDIPVRRNHPGGPSRKASEIAPEEIAAAAALVLRDQIRLSVDDLVTATARVFGYERTGSGVRAAVLGGVRHLIESGAAREDDGVVALAR